VFVVDMWCDADVGVMLLWMFNVMLMLVFGTGVDEVPRGGGE
jgi:hypothetical protein